MTHDIFRVSPENVRKYPLEWGLLLCYNVVGAQRGIVMSNKVVRLLILTWIIFIALAMVALSASALYGLWLFLQF
jgi:hypothetical protein